MAQLNATNPQGFQGWRNLECPHYLCCLDQAAQLSWLDFSCQHCPHQRVKHVLRAEDMDLEAPGWEDIWAETGWER